MSNTVEKWYYYLHENGDLISKSPAAVDSLGPYEYFDSPFVRLWWCITDRFTLMEMLYTAKKAGARPERIAEIEKVNNVTDADYDHYHKDCIGRTHD